MTQDGFKRKLAAILSADVEGYSKLMGDDDEYTVKTISKYRNIINVLVEKHEGRIVDSPGDNILKGHYDKAIKVLEEGVSRKTDWVGNHIILAAAYVQAGRLDDAKREAQEVLRLEPFFEIDNFGTVFRNQDDRAKIVEGLRKAGLN